MIRERISKLQSTLKQAEAFIITSNSNRFYLTEFPSSAGTVCITKKSAVFFTDFRYYEKAKSTAEGCEARLFKKLTDIYSFLISENIKTVYIETQSISISQYNVYKNSFTDIEISKEAVLDTELNELRAKKSKKELELIVKAQELTDRTFEYILNRISAGRTEKEIMLDMEFFMRRLGADGVSFDFIVVSGKNSSLPHGVPTDKKVEKGDFITMDFGAVYKGYCSDMTRTVAVGQISPEQHHVYDTVLKAQTEAIKTIKAGIKCCDADKAARDIIYSAGYEGCFGHSLGHGVGIDIHENPNLHSANDCVLQSGNVVTAEPGIYIVNRFGVRIEDMLYVTDGGNINLTKSKKELIIL